MTKREAVIWLINVTADIGKSEHRDLWHYEQALCEIKEMLEAKPERKTGMWIVFPIIDSRGRRTGDHVIQCVHCGFSKQIWHSSKMPKYCEECGSYNGGEQGDTSGKL